MWLCSSHNIVNQVCIPVSTYIQLHNVLYTSLDLEISRFRRADESIPVDWSCGEKSARTLCCSSAPYRGTKPTVDRLISTYRSCTRQNTIKTLCRCNMYCDSELLGSSGLRCAGWKETSGAIDALEGACSPRVSVQKMRTKQRRRPQGGTL